ncbi:hypothetical protein YB2330_000657 [Saitoella coloradoensis]
MKRSLGDILLADTENVEEDPDVELSDAEPVEEAVDSSMCAECQDQPAVVECQNCDENFCDVCRKFLHRTGKRKAHEFRPLKAEETANGDSLVAEPKKATETSSSKEAQPEDDEDDVDLPGVHSVGSSSTFGDWLTSRAKYIPLRLTHEERKYLRLLEAALSVSEYTDKVDILAMYSSRAKRVVAQLKDMCATLAGLVVASDMKAGQELFQDKDYEDNAEFFQTIFELGRRYKIQNPDKMRNTYGKMMYMVQDSMNSEVEETLGFNLYKPIETVHSFLADRDALGLLKEDIIVHATKEIVPEGKKRAQIQTEIKQKERAIEILSKKHGSSKISREDIRQCLYALGDNHAYLRANRDPCDKMRALLQQYFSPDKPDSEFHLSIQAGRGGARLSHSHQKQYYYVNQSLSLWSSIMHEMYMLWSLSDSDLLSSRTRYRLTDTGQGLNRVQACPGLSRAMHSILSKAQQKAGTWIGSSVIHLGDHNVPNALLFIDKYLQVPRILNPIAIAVEELERIARDPFIHGYIEQSFGGVETLKKTILSDFFKHGFDGSGADNFFDAGSCIDGRLTSAWNWCNTISKKPYYRILLMAGFAGFDGDGF